MPVANLVLRLAALGAIVAIAWVRKDVEGLSLAVTAVGVVTGVEVVRRKVGGGKDGDDGSSGGAGS